MNRRRPSANPPLRSSAAVFALFAIIAPARAASPPPAERLKALEREAQESKARAAELEQRTLAMQKELAAQRENLTSAAAQVRAGEVALTALESEQAALSARLSGEVSLLGGDRERLARLTAALVRLARIPPGGLLVSADAPVDAARAEMLLQSALVATREGEQAAARELARLDDVSQALDAKRRDAERAAANLKSRQAELAALVEKRQSLYQQTEADRQAEQDRAAKIADEAKDLRDLVARIEAEQAAEARREAEEQRKASQRKAASASELAPVLTQGRFVRAQGLPVGGEIKIRFGENDGLGTTSRGMTIVTRPGATVTAPAAGVVRFAGQFRGYREILILEHPGGYHSLIAGMSRTDVALGAAVGAGEPVGAMDDRPDAKPELYYELRRNGQPIDPEAAAGPVDVKRKVR
jgi:septal ring factor EnvC (AmiA/AmiB activator)